MPAGYFSDSDDDPDYRESSADESEEEVKPTYARDRAQWIVDNHEELAELHKNFVYNGRQLFGGAFFQLGDITSFSHYCYNMTTPGAR